MKITEIAEAMKKESQMPQETEAAKFCGLNLSAFPAGAFPLLQSQINMLQQNRLQGMFATQQSSFQPCPLGPGQGVFQGAFQGALVQADLGKGGQKRLDALTRKECYLMDRERQLKSWEKGLSGKEAQINEQLNICNLRVGDQAALRAKARKLEEQYEEEKALREKLQKQLEQALEPAAKKRRFEQETVEELKEEAREALEKVKATPELSYAKKFADALLEKAEILKENQKLQAGAKDLQKRLEFSEAKRQQAIERNKILRKCFKELKENFDRLNGPLN